MKNAMVIIAIIAMVFIFGHLAYQANHHTTTSAPATQAEPQVPQPSTTCIILAVGGQKLCGTDAAAWCRSTDATRLESGDKSDQATCQEIETQYGY